MPGLEEKKPGTWRSIGAIADTINSARENYKKAGVADDRRVMGQCQGQEVRGQDIKSFHP